jgi:hypothetical protein
LNLAAARKGVPPAATIAASCFNSSSDHSLFRDFMREIQAFQFQIVRRRDTPILAVLVPSMQDSLSLREGSGEGLLTSTGLAQA